MTVEEKRLSKKQYDVIYRAKNVEKRKIQTKAYYENNKERINGDHREHYQKNRDSVKRRCSLYRKDNKEKINLYFRTRRQIDPKFRILHILRTRLNHAIKSQKVSKSDTTLNLVGCSIDFLKNFLKTKFVSGMSWENYGEWEIDHIRPCCSFDLSDPEEQKKCFHYTNLQPLWWWENLSKGDKYNFSQNV
jgi:hypothetical protein